MNDVKAFALLLALFPMISATKPSRRAPHDCVPVTFEGSRFTHCIATPGQHQIEMRLSGRDGKIYRGFKKLAADTKNVVVSLAMNGGMYDDQRKPIGYYVERSTKTQPLNMKEGKGNFYIKPNGVFFGSDARWEVMSADAFEAQVIKRPEFGTQSGPMLVTDGVLNPKFDANGTSLYVRNAVGVDARGQAHFVISQEPVSFGRMARVMRDLARTPNALYLDGSVSSLWNPAARRMDSGHALGPLILVTRAKGIAP